MNDDIGKFGYDSMPQRTKKTKIMRRTSLRTFKVIFIIKVILSQDFTKSLSLAKFTSLRHVVNNGVKCK